MEDCQTTKLGGPASYFILMHQVILQIEGKKIEEYNTMGISHYSGFPATICPIQHHYSMLKLTE
jgi:hypothetical protein